MKSRKFLLITLCSITMTLFTSLPIAPFNARTASAACVRMPWQPKDKCKSSTSQRRFATKGANKDVSSALENAYAEVEASLTIALSDARKIRDYNRRNGSRLGASLPDQSLRYMNAILALGGLVTTYPMSVQPTQLGKFTVRYESVKRCYPNCVFNWLLFVK